MVVTKHGRKRFGQRTGLSKKLVNNVAAKALDRGLRRQDASGLLRRFMDSLYYTHNKGNNMRIYHGAVYIFQDDVLITVLPLRHDLRRISDRILRKEKIPS